MENHKCINKNTKVVNLEILKVKTWFGDKDLFSLICLLKTDDFTKTHKFINKTYYFTKTYKFINKSTLFYKNL